MKKGFTLIEMSIVLVIIGILIVALVGGQSLLESAKLDGTIAEITKHRDSYFKFKEIYNAVPGDMPDAVIVWPSKAINANGDGNFEIGDGSTGTCEECVYAWNHLSYAGLVDGDYNAHINYTYGRPGVNIPASSLGSAYGYNFNTFDNTGRNFIIVGKPTSTGYFTFPALSPEDARTIDAKMDDGIAQSGRIMGMDSWGDDLGGSSVSCNDGMNYVATVDELRCQLWVLLEIQ